MFKHAWKYLKYGFSVIPLNGKRPLFSWKKWQSECASNGLVSVWSKKYPNANIGIVTGEISNITVIDFDSEEAWEKAKKKGFPKTPLVKTGRGFHAYCKFDNRVRNFQGKNGLSNIDIKSEGGYIVAPPSVHESGIRYAWIKGRSIKDTPLSDIPEWLITEVNGSSMVEGVMKGQRNTTLARIVGIWTSKGCSYDECVEKALDWNQKNIPPMSEKEVEATVKSIFIRHQEELNTLYDLKPQQVRALNVARKIKVDEKLICIAENFYQYKDGCYKSLEDAEVKEFIINVIGESITRTKLNEIYDFQKIVAHERMDAMNKVKLINLKNGMFDIKECSLVDHREEYLSSIQLGAKFDKKAQCPLWIKTLNEIFEGNQEKVDLLHEYMGLCLTNITKFEKALMLSGEGANGKSVIIHILSKILGGENYSAVPLERFNNPFYLSNMLGKNVNFCIETNAKAPVYDSMFKAIISGDPIEVDQKNKIPFTFRPHCKLIIATNNKPRVDDKTDAFYRRLIVLEFNRQFSEKEQNKNLKKQLEEEIDGIFLLLVDGLKKLLKRGYFDLSGDVQESIHQYRRENNNVLIFVDEECVLSDTCHIPKSNLYSSYKIWCEMNGNYYLSQIKFGRELVQHFDGISEIRKNNERFWKGIALNNQDDIR